MKVSFRRLVHAFHSFVFFFKLCFTHQAAASAVFLIGWIGILSVYMLNSPAARRMLVNPGCFQRVKKANQTASSSKVSSRPVWLCGCWLPTCWSETCSFSISSSPSSGTSTRQVERNYCHFTKRWTSRERPKSAPYLRLKNSKRTSKRQSIGELGTLLWKKFFKKSHNAEKLKGGTLWDFSTSILTENIKNWKGGPFGEIFFGKKSLTEPKILWGSTLWPRWVS